MSKGRVLIHCCCGPCALACIDQLRHQGYEPEACFFNPNIHPSLEYLARREAFIRAMEIKEVPVVGMSPYGLADFLQAVVDADQDRCRRCYRMRMQMTARWAAQMQIALYTTTLLISPYQNVDALNQEGAAAGELWGVSFGPWDFRPLFRQGQEEARNLGLYRQKYCGCIFSEEERYAQRCALK